MLNVDWQLSGTGNSFDPPNLAYVKLCKSRSPYLSLPLSYLATLQPSLCRVSYLAQNAIQCQIHLLLHSLSISYLVLIPMERTPHASDAVVQTAHRLRDLLQLLPVRIAQQQRLLHDLIRVHVPYTDGLLASVDIMPRDDRVLVWAGGDDYFDARVLTCKCRQSVLEKGTVPNVRPEQNECKMIVWKTYFMPRLLPDQSQ